MSLLSLFIHLSSLLSKSIHFLKMTPNFWIVVFIVILFFLTFYSEEPCDTEDWSNDAENSALLHRNKLHF